MISPREVSWIIIVFSATGLIVSRLLTFFKSRRELVKSAEPQPAVTKYTPKYYLRTEAEHEAIRKSLHIDPKSCKHNKGGLPHRGWAPNNHLDFNVGMHKFIDGRWRIRCMNCGQIWWQGDPDWDYALSLAAESTNYRSMSEEPMLCARFAGGAVGYYKSAEEIKAAYPNWDGIIKNSSWGLGE